MKLTENIKYTRRILIALTLIALEFAASTLSVTITTTAAYAVTIENQGTPRVDTTSNTVKKALALLEKFTPGMSYNDTVKLLDAAAASHFVGGKDLVRKGWLHGEFGVEIYFLNEQAYRIDILSQFKDETGVLFALHNILQIGRTKYKAMPRWDSVSNEHYWDIGDLRFSYARSGRHSTEVRVSYKGLKNRH